MNKDKQVAGKIGGARRAEILPPQRRSEIARQAAVSRWGGGIPKALHKGTFKKEFGIDVECYVLNDQNKTAVISQRGMGKAIGFSEGGRTRLPTFIRGEKIAPYVGRELREKLENPIIFQGVGVGTTHGYDVTILIDVCKSIIKAKSDGKLLARQAALARQAHIIVGASAKAGIKQLVYALAGYNPTAEEVITAFKLYVQEEARDYEKEFPPQLYKEWYHLYQLPKPDRNRPWKFKHLTVNHVWHPLARSHGRILELTKAERAKSVIRHKRLHQFLSAIGVKALRTHLGQLLGIAQVSNDEKEYERYVSRIFGDQMELDV